MKLCKWLIIYLSVGFFCSTAAFGYLSGWWSDTAIIAITLSTISAYCAGRVSSVQQVMELVKTVGRIEALVEESAVSDEIWADEAEVAIEELTQRDRVIKLGRCIYCGSQSRWLKDYPYDERFHEPDCPLVFARPLVEDVETAPAELIKIKA